MAKDKIEVSCKGDLALISKYRNALMGVAALIICYFHEFLPVFPDGTALYEAEDLIIRVSFYGVDIFMLLSGMSVATSLLRDSNIGHFYAKRAKRILPIYLLSGVFMILINGWSFKDYLLNISGVRFFTEKVDSYLWFVIAIIIFYLFAPMYQELIEKTGRPFITFIVSFVVWYVLALVLLNYIRSDFYYMIDRIPVFLLGMSIGNMINKGTVIKNRSVFWLGVVCSFVIGWLLSYMLNYYGYLYLFGTILRCFPRILLGFGTAYLVAGILDIVIQKWLVAVLEFFGSFCFELYVVQRVFDAKIHYFLMDRNIWGVPRNLIMLVLLSLIAFAISRAVNWVVDKVCSLDIKK